MTLGAVVGIIAAERLYLNIQERASMSGLERFVLGVLGGFVLVCAIGAFLIVGYRFIAPSNSGSVPASPQVEVTEKADKEEPVKLDRGHSPVGKRQALSRYLRDVERFANEHLRTDGMRRLGFKGVTDDVSMLGNGFLQIYWDRRRWREMSREYREVLLRSLHEEWVPLAKRRTKYPVIAIAPVGDANTNLGKVNGLGELAVYE